MPKVSLAHTHSKAKITPWKKMQQEHLSAYMEISMGIRKFDNCSVICGNVSIAALVRVFSWKGHTFLHQMLQVAISAFCFQPLLPIRNIVTILCGIVASCWQRNGFILEFRSIIWPKLTNKQKKGPGCRQTRSNSFDKSSGLPVHQTSKQALC